MPGNLGGARAAFQARFEKRIAGIIERAEDAMRQAVIDGALALDQGLEASITRTGVARQQTQGGLPGRHRTGTMVSRIRTNANYPERSSGQTFMAFGWFAGDFQDYFRDQDMGDKPYSEAGIRDGKIPGAEQLKTNDGQPGFAVEVAIDSFRYHMKALR